MLVTGSTAIKKNMICGLMELAFQFERKMIKHAINIRWEKFYNRGCTKG